MKRMPEALTDELFDLLILGGGITGAGVALDAVLRGLRVALIDKGDFASGTSSVSSKLVHGGLRYLEHGDFRLVYEALHERRRLLHNAPHLVRPLRFVLPFYDGARVPPWKWRLGLPLRPARRPRQHPPQPPALAAARSWPRFPACDRAGLRGGAEYFDAQMDDARLCLEVLRTAALHGAPWPITSRRSGFETSRRRAGGRAGAGPSSAAVSFPIRARQVLNATGPWVDAVCRLAGDDSGPQLQPTKGVHLVAPDRGLAGRVPAAAPRRRPRLLRHPLDGQDADRHHRHRLRRARRG